MLADTGASFTCIAESVAQELGLPVIDKRSGYGAGGAHVNNVYPVVLKISITNDANITYTIRHEAAVQGIPKLEDHFRQFPGAPRLIGLLGRDLLAHCKMIYDGPAGVVRYEFNDASIQAVGQTASKPPSQ